MFLCCPFPSEKRERRTGIKGKEENGLYTFHQTKTRTDGLFQMLLIQQDLDTVSAGLLCVQAIANSRPVIALLIRLCV